MAEVDVQNELARALLRTQLRNQNPNSTADDFREAWKQHKKAYHTQSRGVIRRLDRAGITLQRKTG